MGAYVRWPIFNGGELHGMNPGYGSTLRATDASCSSHWRRNRVSSTRRSTLRSSGLPSSGSYYEKGASPRPSRAAASDDSNGKNVGVAFAFKFLGDDQRAGGSRPRMLLSPVAAGTAVSGTTRLGPPRCLGRRSRLRHTETYARTPSAACMTAASPVTPTTARKTCNPTATCDALLLADEADPCSGKDADEAMFWKEEEFADLLTIAQGQFNDPTLLEKAGTPVTQRDTQRSFVPQCIQAQARIFLHVSWRRL